MYNVRMHYLVSIDPKRGGSVYCLCRSQIYTALVVVALVSAVSAVSYYGNNFSNEWHSPVNIASAAPSGFKKYVEAHADLRNSIDHDRSYMNSVAKVAEQKINAMSVRLSALQGQIVRLEAMGQRIANMAGLKQDEFNLDDQVGIGGPVPAESLSGSSYNEGPLTQGLTRMESRITSNIDRLMALESLIMDKHLQDTALPVGTPVPGGWISSSYGTRVDPFSGKREFHRGIDISAKKDSRVLAAASGVVIFSGYKTGYGNIVEIQHTEGFLTRYGHNSKNLAAVGETVQKNQAIAIIGSTGRSTGLHVHFEVLKSGVPVNPRKFVLLK